MSNTDESVPREWLEATRDAIAPIVDKGPDNLKEPITIALTQDEYLAILGLARWAGHFIDLDREPMTTPDTTPQQRMLNAVAKLAASVRDASNNVYLTRDSARSAIEAWGDVGGMQGLQALLSPKVITEQDIDNAWNDHAGTFDGFRDILRRHFLGGAALPSKHETILDDDGVDGKARAEALWKVAKPYVNAEAIALLGRIGDVIPDNACQALDATLFGMNKDRSDLRNQVTALQNRAETAERERDELRKQPEIDDADSQKVQEVAQDTIRQLRRERDEARAQVYHYQSDPLDKRTARYERTIIAQAQRIAELEQEKAR